MNPNGHPSGLLDFSLKMDYIGSLQFGRYYLQYALLLNLSITPDLKF
jgi:hypothetical protein